MVIQILQTYCHFKDKSKVETNFLKTHSVSEMLFRLFFDRISKSEIKIERKTETTNISITMTTYTPTLTLTSVSTDILPAIGESEETTSTIYYWLPVDIPTVTTTSIGTTIETTVETAVEISTDDAVTECEIHTITDTVTHTVVLKTIHETHHKYPYVIIESCSTPSATHLSTVINQRRSISNGSSTHLIPIYSLVLLVLMIKLVRQLF